MKLLFAIIMVMLYTTAYAQPNGMFTSKGKELSLLTDDGKRFKIKLQAVKPPKSFVYTEGWRWGSEQSTPKYIIKNIKAWWGSEEVFVPLSAYIDLSNPHDAILRKAGNEIHLIVKGGDAGTSYEALLIFAKGVIRSKKVVHGEFPDEAWEETRYSLRRKRRKGVRSTPYTTLVFLSFKNDNSRWGYEI